MRRLVRPLAMTVLLSFCTSCIVYKNKARSDEASITKDSFSRIEAGKTVLLKMKNRGSYKGDFVAANADHVILASLSPENKGAHVQFAYAYIDRVAHEKDHAASFFLTSILIGFIAGPFVYQEFSSWGNDGFFGD